MIFIGVVAAGLLFGLRDLLPYLSAVTSGSIRRRGYNGAIVRRTEDPERFGRLLGNRLKGALGGFGLAAAAVIVWLGLSLYSSK